MVDRILHIGHRFAKAYDKALLQRAAEVYITNGKAAVVPHLIQRENMEAAEAATLAQNIHAEMLNVNRQVLLYYVVMLSIFLVIVGFSLHAHSYIFAGVFALPALAILYSLLKFIRRNALT